MHIFLNATGASAGSGLTYLYNVVPRLSSLPDVRTTLAVQSPLREEFSHLPNVDVLKLHVPDSTVRRFWFEQSQLPRVILAAKADVLLSAGNFSIRNSPVPQILLSGNSLYTSRDFSRDLMRRREYRMWLDTRIKGVFAKKSVRWADCTVAPSRAFAKDLHGWTGRQVVAVHHGFDADVFFADECPPSTQVAEKISGAQDCLKLLFVSHYNYYRNFETLFRAIALLRQQVPGQKIRLFLTCALRDDLTLGPYKTGAAARVIRDLGIAQEVVELGAIPYRQLHHVYRACHVYITPAYAETFAHPLVEAMACGLPVIASDIPAHREICSTALFFDRFSAEQLGARILEAAPTAGKQVALPERLGFSWSDHVAKLLAIASQLVGETKGRQLAAVARAETPLHRAS